MDFVDELKEILLSKDPVADPYTPAVAAIMPFFDKLAGYEPEEFAQEVLRTLILAQNANQTWEWHRAYQERMGQPTRYPSAETIRRAFRRPPPRNGHIKANRIEQAARHSDVMLAQALAFIEALDVRDGDGYVTIDGSSLPKYGEKAYESKRPLRKQTEASLSAQPLRRSKSAKGNPREKGSVSEHRGTTGGHERLFLLFHLRTTKETITVHIDPHAREDLLGAVRRALAALARLPVRPAFIVVDKQFGGGDVWEALREYADPRGVLLVTPKKRDTRTESLFVRLWQDRLFQPLPLPGPKRWWAFREIEWSKTARAHSPIGFLVTYEVVAFGFQPDNHQGTIVQQGKPGESPRVRAFPIQVNQTVMTAGQAAFILSCVSARWACEALFAGYKMRFGSSKGRQILPRDDCTQLALNALNSYGMWRGVKRRQLGNVSQSALSMTHWMGDLMACIEHPDRIDHVPRLQPTKRRPRTRPKLRRSHASLDAPAEARFRSPEKETMHKGFAHG